MLNIEPYNQDSDFDPAPSFATDAENELADELRRRLEERYLAPCAPSSSMPVRAGTGH